MTAPNFYPGLFGATRPTIRGAEEDEPDTPVRDAFLAVSPELAPPSPPPVDAEYRNALLNGPPPPRPSIARRAWDAVTQPLKSAMGVTQNVGGMLGGAVGAAAGDPGLYERAYEENLRNIAGPDGRPSIAQRAEALPGVGDILMNVAPEAVRESALGRVAEPIVRFGGNLLGDPLTYMTAGIVPGASMVGKALRGGEGLTAGKRVVQAAKGGAEMLSSPLAGAVYAPQIAETVGAGAVGAAEAAAPGVMQGVYEALGQDEAARALQGQRADIGEAAIRAASIAPVALMGGLMAHGSAGELARMRGAMRRGAQAAEQGLEGMGPPRIDQAPPVWDGPAPEGGGQFELPSTGSPLALPGGAQAFPGVAPRAQAPVPLPEAQALPLPSEGEVPAVWDRGTPEEFAPPRQTVDELTEARLADLRARAERERELLDLADAGIPRRRQAASDAAEEARLAEADRAARDAAEAEQRLREVSERLGLTTPAPTERPAIVTPTVLGGGEPGRMEAIRAAAAEGERPLREDEPREPAPEAEAPVEIPQEVLDAIAAAPRPRTVETPTGTAFPRGTRPEIAPRPPLAEGLEEGQAPDFAAQLEAVRQRRAASEPTAAAPEQRPTIAPPEPTERPVGDQAARDAEAARLQAATLAARERETQRGGARFDRGLGRDVEILGEKYRNQRAPEGHIWVKDGDDVVARPIRTKTKAGNELPNLFERDEAGHMVYPFEEGLTPGQRQFITDTLREWEGRLGLGGGKRHAVEVDHQGGTKEWVGEPSAKSSSPFDDFEETGNQIAEAIRKDKGNALEIKARDRIREDALSDLAELENARGEEITGGRQDAGPAPWEEEGPAPPAGRPRIEEQAAAPAPPPAATERPTIRTETKQSQQPMFPGEAPPAPARPAEPAPPAALGPKAPRQRPMGTAHMDLPEIKADWGEALDKDDPAAVRRAREEMDDFRDALISTAEVALKGQTKTGTVLSGPLQGGMFYGYRDATGAIVAAAQVKDGRIQDLAGHHAGAVSAVAMRVFGDSPVDLDIPFGRLSGDSAVLLTKVMRRGGKLGDKVANQWRAHLALDEGSRNAEIEGRGPEDGQSTEAGVQAEPREAHPGSEGGRGDGRGADGVPDRAVLDQRDHGGEAGGHPEGPGGVAPRRPPEPPPEAPAPEPAVPPTRPPAPPVPPAAAAAPIPANFSEFVKAKGLRWPIKSTHPDYKAVKAEWDALRARPAQAAPQAQPAERPAPEQARTANVEGRLLSAIMRRVGSEDGPVTLAELRADLPDIPRAELDDALLKLRRDRKIALTSFSDPVARRQPGVEAGALNVLGEPYHGLYLEDPGRQAGAAPEATPPRPEPGQPPAPPARRPVTAAEAANPLGVLGNLPAHILDENPNGTWSFHGKVDGRLRYVTKDGGEPTAKQFENANIAGPGVVGLKTRVWATADEAAAAARALGYTPMFKNKPYEGKPAGGVPPEIVPGSTLTHPTEGWTGKVVAVSGDKVLVEHPFSEPGSEPITVQRWYRPRDLEPGRAGEPTAAARPEAEGPEERPEPAAEAEGGALRPGTTTLVDSFEARLRSGDGVRDNKVLTQLADEAFGGTRGQGKWTPRDAYDALEAAVNRHIMQGPNFPDGAFDRSTRTVQKDRAVMSELRRLMGLLPRQADRTTEQVEFQQFSTPPTQAFVAASALGIRPGEVLLEPSAGTGGLAAFARAAGADVHANEIAPRRAALLEALGFKTTTVDAEILDDVLPLDLRPTAILMNPPFSATGGRVQKHSTDFGARHVESALKRLADGGRLVAIVGRGMAFDKPAFRRWWDGITSRYNVRANVGIKGDEYGKYGTTFGNQILVIDKTGPTPGADASARLRAAVRGTTLSLEDALEALRPISADRPTPSVETRPEVGPLEAAPREGPGGSAVRTPDASARVPEQPGRDLETAPGRVDVGMEGEGSGAPGGRRGVGPGAAGRGGGGAGGERGGEGSPLRGAEPGRRPPEPPDAGPVPPGARGGKDVSADEPGGAALGTPSAVAAAPERTTRPVARETEAGGTFVRYRPTRIKTDGLVPHPAPVVEAASMAAVDPPDVTYRSALPAEVLREGRLSDLQYETVLYAGQRHAQALPNGAKAGFFIGDGTGVGKGREIAGIILDNSLQGRKRTLWVSVSKDLKEAAKADLDDVAGKGRIQITGINELSGAQGIDVSDGVVFTTYDTLRRADRLKQIKDWKPDLIVFDEAHKAKNAVTVGRAEPSQTGRAVIDLQDSLPDSRVLYVSATGATEVRNMAYMTRLGLWAPEQPKAALGSSPRASEHANRYAFPGGFNEFLSEIENGGVGAKEMVSRDLKALGMYASRSISFDGVEYREAIHELTPDQTRMYDNAARAWQVVLKNIEEALKIVRADKGRRADALKRFWGDHQRFFRQVTTAMKMPTIIHEVEDALRNNESAIVSLKGTAESKTTEKVSRAVGEGASLDDLDFTPREIIAQLVDRAFPTQLYEEVKDPNDPSKTITRPVMRDGKPVQSAEALRLKQKVMEGLSDLSLPDNPLDQLINHFGVGAVAELTGRKRRLVRDQRTGQLEYRKRSGDGISGDRVNLAEMEAFQGGKKRIAVISRAASTGISLHSSRRAKNQQRRRQIAAELDWSADAEMQTIGRSHRSDQVHPPIDVLVSTSIGGEKRFSSTIARRLGNLGALTKGQRDATGGGELAKYNFETTEGESAIRALVENAGRRWGRSEIPGLEDPIQAFRDMGLAREDPRSGSESIAVPDVRQFLNRLLSLDVARQNALFGEFTRIFDDTVRRAKEQGTFDEGVSDIEGLSIRTKGEPTLIHTDATTGAKTHHIVLDVDRATNPTTWAQLESNNSSEGRWSEKGVTVYSADLRRPVEVKAGFYKNKRSGAIVYGTPFGSRTDEASGATRESFRIMRPKGDHQVISAEDVATKWETLTPRDARPLWVKAFDAIPKTETREEHIIAGSILPLWNVLKGSGEERMRVVRATDDNGQRVVGVHIPASEVGRVLQSLGVGREFQSPEAVFRAVWDQGTTVGLAEGLEVRKTRAHGEDRIEVVGVKSQRFEDLRSMGLIEEKIDWKNRFFIPSDESAGLPVMRSLVKAYPPVGKAAAGEVGGGGLSASADSARARLRSIGRDGIVNDLGSAAARGAGAWRDLAIVGADLFVRGAKRFGQWAVRMMDAWGRGIRPFLRDLWDEAQKLVQGPGGPGRGTSAQPPIQPGEGPRVTRGEALAPAPAGRPAKTPRATPRPRPESFDLATGEPPRVVENVANLRAAEAEAGVKPAKLEREQDRSWASIDAEVEHIGRTYSDDNFLNIGKRRNLTDAESQAYDARIRSKLDAKREAAGALVRAQAAGAPPDEVARLQRSSLERTLDYLAHERARVNDGTGVARALAARGRLMEADAGTPRALIKRLLVDLGQERGKSLSDRYLAELVQMWEEGDPHLVDALRALVIGKWEKASYIFRGNLVSALSTDMANHSGNTVYQGVRVVDRMGASVVDALLQRMHGGQRSRFKGEASAEVGAMMQAAPAAMAEYLREMVGLLGTASDVVPGALSAAKRGAGHLPGQAGQFVREGLARANKPRELDLTRPIHEQISPLGGKWAKLWDPQLVKLAVADRMAQNIIGPGELAVRSYRKAVRELGGIEGEAAQARAQEIMAEALRGEGEHADILREVAEAKRERTFQERPWHAAETLLQARARHPWLNFVVPFVTTPANIARATLEHSPFGVAMQKTREARRAFLEAERSGVTGARLDDLRGRYADELAKAAVGTIIFGGAAAMAWAGLLTGSGPEDQKLRSMLKDTGWQPYSLALPLGAGRRLYIPYNRLEPVASLLGIAADVVELKDQKDVEQAVEKAIGSVGANLLSKTYLQGLADVSELVSDPSRAFGEYASNMVGSALVPNLVARGAQAIDPVIRDTKPTDAGFGGVPERVAKRLASRLPGLSMILEPRRSSTGEEIERPGFALSRFALPSQPSIASGGRPVEAELVRIGYARTAAPRYVRVNGQRIDLEPEEQVAMTAADKEATAAVTALLGRREYQALADTMDEGGNRSKEYVIRQQYERARDKARRRILQMAAFRRRAKGRIQEARGTSASTTAGA